MEKLMTKTDVCEVLQISPATLDRLVARGEIKAFKLSGSVRFLPTEIQDYVRRCIRAAEAPAVTVIPGRKRQKPAPAPERIYIPGMKVV